MEAIEIFPELSKLVAVDCCEVKMINVIAKIEGQIISRMVDFVTQDALRVVPRVVQKIEVIQIRDWFAIFHQIIK
jgi:hypothetical protein